VALEHEVQTTKRITSYGISSSSFSLDDVNFLPYQNLLTMAAKVGTGSSSSSSSSSSGSSSGSSSSGSSSK